MFLNEPVLWSVIPSQGDKIKGYTQNILSQHRTFDKGSAVLNAKWGATLTYAVGPKMEHPHTLPYIILSDLCIRSTTIMTVL